VEMNGGPKVGLVQYASKSCSVLDGIAQAPQKEEEESRLNLCE
jgi:hypothetical protein